MKESLFKLNAFLFIPHPSSFIPYLRRLPHVAVEEIHHQGIDDEAVRELVDAVPFIIEELVFDRSIAFTKGFDDLLGLRVGDARIVLALNDHQWCFDARDFGERRDAAQEFSVSLKRAVLDFAQLAAIARGVL
jgi:hypothetical protein